MKVQLGAAGPPVGSVSRAEGWRAVTRVLRSCAGLASLLRDDQITTFFPADCRVCGGPMTAWRTTPICAACVDLVEPQAGALCTICGEDLGLESARFAASHAESTCTPCRRIPPRFRRAVAYAVFADEIREMLHLLKYERMRRLADGDLGRWMAAAILQLEAEMAREVSVIAVPLFAARERKRGFNQSVLLADAALRRLRASHPDWKLRAEHSALERTRDTDAQFGLTPGERRRNLRNAFRVLKDSAVRGREVLLVDDVMTTGATARECARVLMAAGATSVWVATLARAQTEGPPDSASSVAMWEVTPPHAATGFS